ncbi:MAG: ABC transporter ATP-binding protein [Oligoflexia bacterium]|nr:ABC transporter ATP-binding protein [Oligoflexia bacterium]MBF0364247.1 ABC transporter ATP-binding protein [Oligoflexia bacterium]
MTTPAMITIKNLCKNYPLLTKGSKSSFASNLKNIFTPANIFPALKNINITITAGECVGIIGPNGSGKSTLLKVLTGITPPSSGEVQAHGKIAALLELGAGLNPELSGLENIYFHGHLFGFTRREMQAKIPEITTFADLGEFIHVPVKKYSSGMFVRLAFSLSIHNNPDILIVDEALAVGDINFQAKCFRHFNKLRDQGKTILFVTHSLEYVMQYCHRGIVLSKGEKIFDGSPKAAIDNYKQVMSGIEAQSTQQQQQSECLSYGNKQAEILDYALIDSEGKRCNRIVADDPFSIHLKIKFHQKIENPIIAYTIKDLKGVEITGTNTYYLGEKANAINSRTFLSGETIVITFEQQLPLKQGGYALSLGVTSFTENGLEVYHRLYDVILFEVLNFKQMVGFFDPESEIKIAPHTPSA